METIRHMDLPRGKGNGRSIPETGLCQKCPFHRDVVFPSETLAIPLVQPEAVVAICLLGEKWKRLKPNYLSSKLPCAKLAPRA